MKELTLQILAKEYAAWVLENGQGRNTSDLRFGQYIWCHYEVDGWFQERHSGLDGFGAEKADVAYQQFLDKLELDYSEASFKLDKFLPEDQEIQEEYYEIKETNDMKEFLETHAEEDRMYSYFPEGGTIYGFSQYLANQNKQ